MNPQELRELLTPLVGDYPHPQMALVPLLHVLLDTERSITNEAMPIVAEICGVEVRSVAEIVAHYAAFQKKPETVTSVCLGLPCYLNGSKAILDNLKAGQPLADGRIKDVDISLCLGHCYAAPVLKLADGTICKATLSENQSGNASPL